jgi:hypothetical protein
LSDNFPIQNGLQQGDALSPLLFKFSAEYAIRKVQEAKVGLKLKGTYQLLIYLDNANLPGGNIDISIYGSTVLSVGSWPVSQFLNLIHSL